MAVSIQGLLNQDPEPTKEKVSLYSRVNLYLAKLSRVPLKEKLFFLQHLKVMLKAGISLSVALKTLAQQSANPKFCIVLKDIASKVDKGVSFTESLREHEKVFGELFINMVEAGELSGKLETVLERLYIQTKKTYELRSKIKGAMTYPAVVISAMLGIGVFMIVFIIPKITAMFEEFDAQLPLPTRILISVSKALTENGILSIVIFIATVAFLVKFLQTNKGKYVFHTFLLKMPILSGIVKQINLAQFARTISSLLKTDIMIIKTFLIASSILGNIHYRRALVEMSERIKKGGKISDVVANYPKLFPPIVVQMVAVGEETGELDNILEELADFYESEVDQIMENLPSIIEPLLILVLGCAIGGIALSVLMPMFTITSSV